MGTTLPLRAWTAAEYGQMVAAGVLAEDDRVELIEGAIVERTPLAPGTPHRSTRSPASSSTRWATGRS